jgi:ABC-type nitrate/sulfonate/bicarbonate transport system permease component
MTTAATRPTSTKLATPKGVPNAAFRRRARSSRSAELLYGLAGIVVLLIAWQVCVDAGLVDVKIASTPIRVAKTLGHLFATGDIWTPIRATASEVGEGMLVSLVIGIPLGLILGRARRLYAMTEPLINILNSVPYVLFVPVIIFWFGIGQESRVLLVIWASIIPLIVNSASGVRNLDPDYLRVSRAFCAGRLLFYRSVLLPAALPQVLTGIRLSLARGLVGAIVAEFFLSGSGIGYFVQTASSNFDMDTAMAGITIMAVAAVVLTRAIGLLEKHFTYWSQSN